MEDQSEVAFGTAEGCIERFGSFGGIVFVTAIESIKFFPDYNRTGISEVLRRRNCAWVIKDYS